MDSQYWLRGLSRRRFLGTSMVAGAGIAGAALIGCGSSNKGTSTPAASGAAGSSAKPSGPTAASISGNDWQNREPDATPKYGGILNWAAGSPTLANLDPLTSASAMVHNVASVAYSQLTRTTRDPKDRNSSIVYRPDLAASWETTDPLKMTFKLRSGVKWHNIAPVNGRVLTAEDVKFALLRTRDDKTSLFRGSLSSIKSIDTPDANTLVVNATAFDPLLFGVLSNQGPWIVPKELVDRAKTRQQMIGTGPFVFQQWDQDAKIAFKKNPDYFVKGTPFVDELNILQIANEETRNAALQSGQTQFGDIPAPAYDQFKSNKNITIEPYTRVSPQVLFFNYKDPKWKDERVRQAVSIALDTDVMVKLLVEKGLWRGIVSNQHDGWTLSQDELKSNKYYMKQDLAKAKQLMSAAGNPDGLSSSLLYATSYPQSYQDATQYMIETLTKNKIVTLKGVGQDLATMRKGQDEHTYDGLCFGLDGQGAPELFLKDYATGGAKNGSGLSDPAVDADVSKFLATVDVKERQAATRAFIDKYLPKVMYKREFADGTLYEGWNKDTHNYVAAPPFQYTSGYQFIWLGNA